MKINYLLMQILVIILLCSCNVMKFNRGYQGDCEESRKPFGKSMDKKVFTSEEIEIITHQIDSVFKEKNISKIQYYYIQEFCFCQCNTLCTYTDLPTEYYYYLRIVRGGKNGTDGVDFFFDQNLKLKCSKVTMIIGRGRVDRVRGRIW